MLVGRWDLFGAKLEWVCSKTEMLKLNGFLAFIILLVVRVVIVICILIAKHATSYNIWKSLCDVVPKICAIANKSYKLTKVHQVFCVC